MNDASRRARLSWGQCLQFNDLLVEVVRARLPLPAGLREAAGSRRSQVGAACHSIADQLDAGTSLESTLAQHRDILPAAYISAVQAGATASQLAAQLEHLSSHLRGLFLLRRELVLALLYPLTVFLSSLPLLGQVANRYLLSILDIMRDSAIQNRLPPPSGLLVWLQSVTAFVAAYGWLLACLAIGLVIVAWAGASRRSVTLRGAFGLLAVVPGVAAVVRDYCHGTLSLVYGELLDAGVERNDALQLAANLVGDPRLQQGAAQVITREQEAAVATGPQSFPGYLHWLTASRLPAETPGEAARRLGEQRLNIARQKGERLAVVAGGAISIGLAATIVTAYAMTVLYPFTELLDAFAAPNQL